MSSLLAALKAHEILLANAASNVANMNTEGYRSLRATITSSHGGEPTVVISRDKASNNAIGVQTEPSGVDLAREFSDLIVSQRGYEAILAAISCREDMFHDLMSIINGKNE
ncbi:MAG: flagellar basal body rod C-terminal domain-containing protein [Desulfomonilia bacterium]